MTEEMAADWVIPVTTMVGTIFAGVGLKVVEGMLAKAKEKDSSAKDFRDELRSELIAVKAERDQVELEMAEWRRKYYELLELFILLKAQLDTASRMLESLGKEVPGQVKMPPEVQKHLDTP